MKKATNVIFSFKSDSAAGLDCTASDDPPNLWLPYILTSLGVSSFANCRTFVAKRGTFGVDFLD